MNERSIDGARRPVVWTIAGNDSGGGAGLHADARACDAFGAHAAGVVAAITAQHSLGVERVEAVSPALLDAQLAALASDMPPAAIKTGLLGSADNVRVVVAWVRRLRAEGRAVPLVVDPVFAATTGASFSDEALRAAWRDELLPLATLATPNLAEARLLAGVTPSHACPRDAAARTCEAASLARTWRGLGVEAVVVTGGDVVVDADAPPLSSDWLDSDHGLACRGWLALPRIETPHAHGTGCSFASAAAAALAHGFVAADAAVLAKMATAEALRHAYPAGAGAGPVAARAGFARRLANLPTLADDLPARLATPFTAMPPGTRGLYAIVDSADWVARVVAAGVRLVQLRIKDAAPYELVHEIRAALAYAGDAGASLIVNDHWQLALELGAHGVHLGQDDLAGVDFAALRRAGLLLGISTHSYWEVCRARALQPSYIACGPVHATQLKRMPWRPQGEGNLAYWCELLRSTPVVAIGGMDAPRARAAMMAGAANVAAVGAITRSADPEAAIAHLQEAIEQGTRLRGGGAGPAWARATLAGFAPTYAQSSSLLAYAPGTYRVRVTTSGNKSQVLLDMPAVKLVDQQIVTIALTPTTGGILLDGSMLSQQGAYTAARNTTARVRLAAAVSGSVPVTASAGSSVIDSFAAAPAVGTYAIVPASGALNISVNGNSVGAPASTLKAGNDYTLLIYGSGTSATASLISDDNHLPTLATNVKMRLINGLTGTATGLTLEADFNPVASNVLPAVASAYGTVPANSSMELDVTSALSSTPIYSRTGLNIAGSSIYTLFMVGDASAPQGLLRRDR